MSYFRRRLMASGKNSKYILFESPEVEKICVQNWSSDGIGLTPTDAARVTTITRDDGFYHNGKVNSFSELSMFINLRTLGDYAFEYTPIRGNIVFPKSLTSIGYRCFANIAALNRPYPLDGRGVISNLKIGSNVTFIGEDAFFNQSYLLTVTVEAVTIPRTDLVLPYDPQGKGEGNANPFSGYEFANNDKVKLYVPAIAVNTYKQDGIWNEDFGGRIYAI